MSSSALRLTLHADKIFSESTSNLRAVHFCACKKLVTRMLTSILPALSLLLLVLGSAHGAAFGSAHDDHEDPHRPRSVATCIEDRPAGTAALAPVNASDPCSLIANHPGPMQGYIYTAQAPTPSGRRAYQCRCAFSSRLQWGCSGSLTGTYSPAINACRGTSPYGSVDCDTASGAVFGECSSGRINVSSPSCGDVPATGLVLSCSAQCYGTNAPCLSPSSGQCYPLPCPPSTVQCTSPSQWLVHFGCSTSDMLFQRYFNFFSGF